MYSVRFSPLWIKSHSNACGVLTLMRVLQQYKPRCVCPLGLFDNWHRFNIAILFGFFTSAEPKAFDGADRAHKHTAKCYNRGRINFTSAFPIALFALESCQVSFTWNVCRDKLKTSVMCWLCGYTDVSTGVSEDQRDGCVKGDSADFINLSV